MSPYVYIETKPSEDEGAERWGYAGPGWYFYDETWAYCHGPFEALELTKTAMKEYARNL